MEFFVLRCVVFVPMTTKTATTTNEHKWTHKSVRNDDTKRDTVCEGMRERNIKTNEESFEESSGGGGAVDAGSHACGLGEEGREGVVWGGRGGRGGEERCSGCGWGRCEGDGVDGDLVPLCSKDGVHERDVLGVVVSPCNAQTHDARINGPRAARRDGPRERLPSP